ncbi:hypothetical protein ACFRDV_08835 [Streptomyces fagopyri]|uniref:hypothetical protein n=1 Tax=Streptomyces fagopyri TaxID=2662397 RepID=UPI003695418F
MEITAEKRHPAVRRGAAGLAVAVALATTVTATAGSSAVAATPTTATVAVDTTPAAATNTSASVVIAANTSTTATATVATTSAAPSAGPYDFGDCPAIPAGVDAARWKCEVLTATGSLTLGSRTVPELAPMTLTHAEGPLPDGSDGQVWGALRSASTPVPGGLLGTGTAGHGPLLPLALRPEYGGRSDFYSTGNSLGLFTLRFRALSPLLPHGCVIGGDAPIELRLQRAGDSEWESQDPPVIRFDAYDDTFTAPAPVGCGPLGRLVDDRLGLPRTAGNAITLSARYTFKTYDRLLAR